jgi:catechol 2,3-dioxygenase-like lactoylglutathione lyase family enzyme
MLSSYDAIATVAVKDLQKARTFYEKTLGLVAQPSDESMVASYGSGGSRVLVYVSQFAGTNQATAATWAVDDVEAVARDLKSRGVTFERYDMPNATHVGDVHVMGKRKAAWFKDPDGNILSIVNRA